MATSSPVSLPEDNNPCEKVAASVRIRRG
ncbi:hypothetical protein Goshw_020211 [Gossypium schwendimanii]|uniref:Uncharacterized protein n=2 Tax=Gossypium TaxID=3633 RepID=A0A7J9DN54_9ROSI|nr:hypothetical protein [Gossypium trilobum]MBA0851461.1 hypothetical protein [Gossypium schwendimanii]